MLHQMKKYNPKEFFKKFKKKTIVCDKGNFVSIFVAYLEHGKKMMNVIMC